MEDQWYKYHTLTSAPSDLQLFTVHYMFNPTKQQMLSRHYQRSYFYYQNTAHNILHYLKVRVIVELSTSSVNKMAHSSSVNV